MRNAASLLLVALLAAGSALSASSGAALPRDHDITIEDYFTLAWIREVAVSPDGRQVAYTEERWEEEDRKSNRDLWVADMASGERRRLTFDRASDAGPRWSPDGRWIYFTSRRERAGEEVPPLDGKKQVWRVPAAGGEPQAVTRVKEGIDAYDLTRDGRTLYYAVGVEKKDPEWEELRKRHDGVEYGHGVTEFSELWRLDLESWRAKKVVDERRVIRGFAVSPDGRGVAMRTTPDEELIHNEGWSRLDVLDTGSGTVTSVTPDGWRKDHPSPFGWIEDGVWSDDGEALAFSVAFDGYPTRVYGWSGSGMRRSSASWIAPAASP